MELITKNAVAILDRAARRQFQIECEIDNQVKFFKTRSNVVWARVYARDLVEAVRLYDSKRSIFARKCLEWALGKLHIFWSKEEKGIAIRPSPIVQQVEDNFNMNEQSQSVTDGVIRNPNEKFIWFGGVVTPDLRSHLLRMEDSPIPTGLLQPINEGGVIKTVQWGINSAAVSLFNYDAMSLEDMKSVIQRDTTGDWFPEDLERKRQLYQDAGDSFEQVARIKIKRGWMLVRFQSHRIGVGNLVVSTGQQESEVVERPELLVAA